MSKLTMPKRPERDGFLAIRLAGHEVEVNAYRDSTLDDYAEAYAAAKVREALEEAAKVCESRVGTGDPGVDTEDADTEAKECAMAIRALIQNQTGGSNVATD